MISCASHPGRSGGSGASSSGARCKSGVTDMQALAHGGDGELGVAAAACGAVGPRSPRQWCVSRAVPFFGDVFNFSDTFVGNVITTVLFFLIRCFIFIEETSFIRVPF